MAKAQKYRAWRCCPACGRCSSFFPCCWHRAVIAFVNMAAYIPTAENASAMKKRCGGIRQINRDCLHAVKDSKGGDLRERPRSGKSERARKMKVQERAEGYRLRICEKCLLTWRMTFGSIRDNLPEKRTNNAFCERLEENKKNCTPRS